MLTPNMERVAACHECGPTWGTLWLDVILLQHDALLRKAGHRWGLHGWVMPRDIVEAEIVREYENDMGLSVVLGPPLLLGEATVAECHQEGDQHSSSQLILLKAVLVR